MKVNFILTKKGRKLIETPYGIIDYNQLSQISDQDLLNTDYFLGGLLSGLATAAKTAFSTIGSGISSVAKFGYGLGKQVLGGVSSGISNLASGLSQNISSSLSNLGQFQFQPQQQQQQPSMYMGYSTPATYQPQYQGYNTPTFYGPQQYENLNYQEQYYPTQTGWGDATFSSWDDSIVDSYQITIPDWSIRHERSLS